MTEPLTEFDSLMEQVRAGSQDAAQQLYDLYSEPVQVVVRRALHQRLRRHYDSIDFLQSVWATFFLEPGQGYAFKSPDELVKFLSKVAFNKVVDKTRQRLKAQKRDDTRVVSLEDKHDKLPIGEALPVRGPTASQHAMAEERWENLLAGQPPEFQRALELLRQGHSQVEVADVLGIHPKLLQRILQDLRSRVTPS